MKKICCLLLLCVISFSSITMLPLTAETKESELYYVNTQLLKIFPHAKGYYVIYKRSGMETGEAFIPLDWFKTHKGNKADIAFINGRINPYVSFFIRDGKCEYVRVFAPRNLKSQVWGLLQAPHEYDEKFDGVETLALEF